MDNIWDETYRRDTVRDLPGVVLLSVVAETRSAQRYVVGRIEIDTHPADGAVSTSVHLNMSPLQMRALAASLLAHASRIEHQLMPIAAEPAAAPSLALVPPAPLYAEPEAAA